MWKQRFYAWTDKLSLWVVLSLVSTHTLSLSSCYCSVNFWCYYTQVNLAWTLLVVTPHLKGHFTSMSLNMDCHHSSEFGWMTECLWASFIREIDWVMLNVSFSTTCVVSEHLCLCVNLWICGKLSYSVSSSHPLQKQYGLLGQEF